MHLHQQEVNNQTDMPLTGKIVGLGVSTFGAIVANIEQVEAFMRILASAVAIISGLTVMYFTVSDRIKKRKHNRKHWK